MKTTILVALGLALAAGACDRKNNDPTPSQQAAEAPADNTRKNERDRSHAGLTPGDQAENERDRTITQRIRQGVMNDDSLSMTAKNVKIITIDGVVTLRGPVKSEKERTSIGAMALGIDNVKRVDNQLEIAPN